MSITTLFFQNINGQVKKAIAYFYIEFVYKTHYILLYIVNFPALFVG